MWASGVIIIFCLAFLVTSMKGGGGGGGSCSGNDKDRTTVLYSSLDFQWLLLRETLIDISVNSDIIIISLINILLLKSASRLVILYPLLQSY